MPIARASELALEGAWAGPALPRGEREARVHSVFRSAINLELEGCDYLCCLTGPAGEGIPNAIVLASSPDFRDCPLVPGSRGLLDDARLVLGPRGAVRVDLRLATRAAREAPTAVARLGIAFDAGVAELDRAQAELGCDLSLAALLGREGGLLRGELTTAMGRRLASAARALGPVARALGESLLGYSAGAADRAVGRLIGLGGGLTPSGDDFLCGFLCASRCAGRDGEGAAPRLAEAVELRADATGAISRSFLLCAARGFFPRELHTVASSIAADDPRRTAASVRRLCGMGHSSGADMATGFFYGLSVFASIVRRGSITIRTHFLKFRGFSYHMSARNSQADVTTDRV